MLCKTYKLLSTEFCFHYIFILPLGKDALAYCASKEKAGNSAHIMDPEVDQDILTVGKNNVVIHLQA